MMPVTIPSPDALSTATALLASLSDPKASADKLEKLSAATAAYDAARLSSIEERKALAGLQKELADKEALLVAREDAATAREAKLEERDRDITGREDRFAEVKRRVLGLK